MKNPNTYNTDLQFFMVDEKCTRGKRIIGPKPKEAPPEVGEVGTKNATNKEKTERDQTKKKPQSWKNKKINDIFNIWLEFNWFLLWFVFIVFMKQKSNRNNRGFTEKNMKKENALVQAEEGYKLLLRYQALSKNISDNDLYIDHDSLKNLLKTGPRTFAEQILFAEDFLQEDKVQVDVIKMKKNFKLTDENKDNNLFYLYEFEKLSRNDKIKFNYAQKNPKNCGHLLIKARLDPITDKTGRAYTKDEIKKCLESLDILAIQKEALQAKAYKESASYQAGNIILSVGLIVGFLSLLNSYPKLRAPLYAFSAVFSMLAAIDDIQDGKYGRAALNGASAGIDVANIQTERSNQKIVADAADEDWNRFKSIDIDMVADKDIKIILQKSLVGGTLDKDKFKRNYIENFSVIGGLKHRGTRRKIYAGSALAIGVGGFLMHDAYNKSRTLLVAEEKTRPRNNANIFFEDNFLPFLSKISQLKESF